MKVTTSQGSFPQTLDPPGRGLWRRQRGPFRLSNLPGADGLGQTLSKHSSFGKQSHISRVPWLVWTVMFFCVNFSWVDKLDKYDILREVFI